LFCIGGREREGMWVVYVVVKGVSYVSSHFTFEDNMKYIQYTLLLLLVEHEYHELPPFHIRGHNMKYIQYTLLLVEHEYHELPPPKIEMFKALIIKKGQPIDLAFSFA
jgi:hypothetical protein